MEEIREKLQEILRNILEDDGLVLRDNLAAADIPNWDSLAQLNIVIAAERAFGVRFTTAEIASLNKPGRNIGYFLSLIAGKQRPS